MVFLLSSPSSVPVFLTYCTIALCKASSQYVWLAYPIPSLPCNLSNVDCFNVMNCSTYKMLIGVSVEEWSWWRNAACSPSSKHACCAELSWVVFVALDSLSDHIILVQLNSSIINLLFLALYFNHGVHFWQTAPPGQHWDCHHALIVGGIQDATWSDGCWCHLAP